MLFDKSLIVEDKNGELDWQEEKLLKDFPHLIFSSRDDANQKMFDSAMTPEIFFRVSQLEANINLKVKGLVLSNIIILLFLVYILQGVV